ncbi:chitinase [Anaerocolumna xylanovorans]|uniref:chitinase n=1 Tax=Anaerocolumna xylanovorans DSM 12503 TaxID=1121345 RepID=A0A1M7YEH9_9FIRM|nr:chitobiase/beta-hexosaminidase C-terminal domain-containing protein [Anaerocolumna xylanovorans]SHO50908.1 Chitinase [Anaerocolumna xylanovorans DSM 12503]
MNKKKLTKATAFIIMFVMVFSMSFHASVKAAYPAWQAGTAYKTGDIVSYGDSNYKCVQGHTALTGWEPPVVPALWSLYSGGSTQTVATPVISPAGGTYSASQTVTIACSTAGSTIRYTLNGDEPSASSTEYKGAITIAATTTVKAKAFLSGMNDSQTATAVYTIIKDDTVASPVFTPAEGTYYGNVDVTLKCVTSNATIYYTTDGSAPTASSKVYSGVITLTATTTIKAFAKAPNLKDSAVVTASYTISKDNTNLPTHILTGYWQNFDNGAKCLKISDVPQTYNIIAIAFAEATANQGEVTFKLDSSLASKLGGYTEQQFISDIAAAKAKKQKVIISVGGETGSVSVSNATAATNFANSVYALMVKYGFDGVDIDLENGINATYMTSALRQLSQKAGSGLIITMAPQTLDMQSVNSGYFQVALNIKDILTVVNTQYYNSGSMLGQDGKVYSQGSVDFITALAAIQLENGLRPDQVGLGLPASTRGAGSGYVSPSVVNAALDCLTTGTGGGSYKPPRTYPSLRGAMTWSINWDASNNYDFANTVSAKLKTLP